MAVSAERQWCLLFQNYAVIMLCAMCSPEWQLLIHQHLPPHLFSPCRIEMTDAPSYIHTYAVQLCPEHTTMHGVVPILSALTVTARDALL